MEENQPLRKSYLSINQARTKRDKVLVSEPTCCGSILTVVAEDLSLTNLVFGSGGQGRESVCWVRPSCKAQNSCIK